MYARAHIYAYTGMAAYNRLSTVTKPCAAKLRARRRKRRVCGGSR